MHGFSFRTWIVGCLFACSTFAQADTLGQSAQSQLLLMIQQLQSEVRQLRGAIETQQYKLDRLEREQLERYRDMDRRLSALIVSQSDDLYLDLPPDDSTNATTETAEGSVAESDSAPGPSETVSSQPVDTQTTEPVAQAPSISDQEAYQAAFQLVRERRFDESLDALNAFIETYPGSDNLANAHYWVGEVMLAQQRLEPAKAAFLKVVEEFPAHRKRPDALYKLGVVQDRLGDPAAQQATFQSLISEYPSSSASGLARNYQSR